MATAIAPVADAVLAAALSVGERLVARATAPHLTVALDQLGDIDIPEPVASNVGAAQLRALATLYLAADIESAGVIASVESLAGLASTGATSIDPGGAEPLLADWWRRRHERVSAPERSAFFSRLFGTAPGPVAADAEPNVQFEDRMLELCEALYKLDELATNATFGGFAQQARVRAAASRIIETITSFSSGIAVFMAQEILSTLKEALAILGHAEVRGELGARDFWAAIERIARLARRQRADGRLHLRRGRAGMTVLAWLGEAAPFLPAPAQPLVGLDHPVIASAVDWLEASLALSEAAGYEAPAQAPASPWAAIAG